MKISPKIASPLLLLSLTACRTPPPDAVNEPLTEFITYALLLLGLGALVLVTWTQDEPMTNQETTRDIPVTSFDTLDASGKLSLLITQGEVHRVSVRGKARQLDRLRIRQEGPALVLASRFGWWQEPVFVTVVVPTLHLLDLSGASLAKISGFEAFQHLIFDLSGASSVTFNGQGERVSIDASGACKLTLTGQVQRFDVELSGATSVAAAGLQAADVNVNLSGACSAHVQVTTHLWADLSGASSLRYRGTPIVEVHNSGASSVSRY